jgi:hypothetical protein
MLYLIKKKYTWEIFPRIIRVCIWRHVRIAITVILHIFTKNEVQ